jgi:hypothetical protein
MKKILFLFVIILFSCSKEPSYCWDCFKDWQSPTATSSSNVELCGLSEKEIGETMAQNTYTSGITQFSMRCSKKQ